jgi:hypothetical protein
MKKWRLATTSQLLKANKKKLSKGVKNNWIVASLWAAYCQYIGKKMRLHHVLVGLTS